MDCVVVVCGVQEGVWPDLRLRGKLIWTTVIAGLIWAVLAYVILGGLITRADVANLDRMFR